MLGFGVSKPGSAHSGTVQNDFMSITEAPFSVIGAYGDAKIETSVLQPGRLHTGPTGCPVYQPRRTIRFYVFVSISPDYREKVGESLGAKVNLDEPPGGS